MLEYPAFKLLIKDLQKCTKDSDNRWKLNLSLEKLPNITKIVPINYIWIEGYIEQLAGKENQVLIIGDLTGKVKITHCHIVPGGSSWIMKGMYCSVVGALTKVCALPEIAAIKINDLSGNKVFNSLWPKEVEELKVLALGKAMPQL